MQEDPRAAAAPRPARVEPKGYNRFAQRYLTHAAPKRCIFSQDEMLTLFL